MNVLIVGAHPDDETFSMGGTLARHIAEGDKVYVLVIADGVTARNRGIQRQEECFIKAMAIYGVTNWEMLQFKDQQLDAMPLLKIVQPIEAAIKAHKPLRVYSHSSADVGQDHRRVAEAVSVATRPNPGMPVKTVLAFYSPSSTAWGNQQFRANYFVDVTKYVRIKTRVIGEAYQLDSPPAPHVRSQFAIQEADWLTASRIGLNGYVEAFELLRAVG